MSIVAIAEPPGADVLALDNAFYAPAEVAEIASVSSSTILYYIHAGKLVAVRLSERTYRIPRNAVVRLLGLGAAPPQVIEEPRHDVSL